MVTTVIEKNTIEITDTSIAILPRSPVIVPGTEFLFRFTDAASNPNADGALTNAMAFANMVDGKPGATFTAGGAGVWTNVAGKAGVNISASDSGYVSLGDNYDHAVDLHPFVRAITFKIPTTGYITTNYQQFFDDTDGNLNTSQWGFDSGIGGIRPRGSVGYTSGGTGAATSAPNTDITPGAVLHLAMSWSPGNVTAYVNGVAQTPAVTSNVNTLANPTGPIKLKGVIKMTVYELFGEDLTVSGRTAAAAVAASYADAVAQGYV